MLGNIIRTIGAEMVDEYESAKIDYEATSSLRKKLNAPASLDENDFYASYFIAISTAPNRRDKIPSTWYFVRSSLTTIYSECGGESDLELFRSFTGVTVSATTDSKRLQGIPGPNHDRGCGSYNEFTAGTRGRGSEDILWKCGGCKWDGMDVHFQHQQRVFFDSVHFLSC